MQHNVHDQKGKSSFHGGKIYQHPACIATASPLRYGVAMIQRPFNDSHLEEHLQAIAGDGMDIYLLAENTARLVIVHGTTMVNHMRANHQLSLNGARILGEAYLLAGVAASSLKNNEVLGVVVESSGALRGISVDANAFGQIRGYLQNEVHNGEALDTGILEIVRSGPHQKHPFRGQVGLVPNGSLAASLEEFYRRSEQTPTALMAEVFSDEQQRITGAAAILVQQMPGATTREFAALEAALRRVHHPGAAFAQGATAADLIPEVFNRWNPRLVATRGTEFFCGCTGSRFLKFLGALPRDEQRDILENGPFPLVTTCHNCNTSYAFEIETLQAAFTGELPPEHAGEDDRELPQN